MVNNFVQREVINEYLIFLSEFLAEALNVKVVCQVVLQSDVDKLAQQEVVESENVESVENDEFLKKRALDIKPDYTFDNFIVGQSNAEPRAAALAASLDPGKFYNPLFIYGDSGLGKSHLLQAIANYIKSKNSDLKVLLMSASDFVDGIYTYNSNLNSYKNKLAAVDVFLIDDIQFLAGKEKSNEIFFRVFNDLVNKKKQIVLTSDRPPLENKGLEGRLVSRFSSGLTVSVSAPEFETAVKIIKSKLERQASSLDIDDSVVDYIAANYSKDVRTIEGALNNLIFSLINTPEKEIIDLPFAHLVLKGKDNTFDELTIKTIKSSVREFYGLSKGQLEGKSRTSGITQARHIAMFLCRKHLDVTFDEIGNSFGKRDHSTVMSACERIDRLIKTDKNYKIAINKIEDLFKPKK